MSDKNTHIPTSQLTEFLKRAANHPKVTEDSQAAFPEFLRLRAISFLQMLNTLRALDHETNNATYFATFISMESTIANLFMSDNIPDKEECVRDLSDHCHMLKVLFHDDPILVAVGEAGGVVATGLQGHLEGIKAANRDLYSETTIEQEVSKQINPILTRAFQKWMQEPTDEQNTKQYVFYHDIKNNFQAVLLALGEDPPAFEETIEHLQTIEFNCLTKPNDVRAEDALSACAVARFLVEEAMVGRVFGLNYSSQLSFMPSTNSAPTR